MDHREDDNRWDYDCPQFVDFTMPMPFNDGADQMFESTVIGEGPTTCTPQFQSHDSGADLTSQEVPVVTEQHEKVEETAAEPVEEQTAIEKKLKKPSNLVSSLEEWRKPTKHPSSGPDESPNSKKQRMSAKRMMPDRQKSSSQSQLMRSKSVRLPKTGSVSSLLTHKPAVAATGGVSAVARSTRSHTRTLSQSRPRSNSEDMGETKKDTSTSRPPKKPKMLKSLGTVSSSKVKSSEDMELERIQQLKKELQHKRHLAQESYKKAMNKAVPVPVHSKDPTLPQEFHFQTDSRIKGQNEKPDGNASHDFVKSLRSRTVVSPASSATEPKKLTIPQPFHLTEKHHTSTSKTSTDHKFESMAEKVSAFHRKTPERFRARVQSGERVTKRGARSVSPGLKLTQPHTPNLTARGRSRPKHFLSQEQLEAQQVEEMKQNQFKANPVNTKVLSNPGIGVKKVPSKPATEIEEFSLSAAVPRKKVEEDHFEFHANPVNKKIFEGPVGIKPVKPAMPTVPMSPAFALKHRVRLPVELPEEKVDATGTTRAKPVPHTGIPFQPKLPHQHTVPEPFNVEERSKVMLAQRDEKIKQVLEEERKAREFYAMPLPSHEVGGLPEKKVKEPTVPEPFQLETDQRGNQYQQELGHKVGRGQLTQEEEELKKAARFRAQPNRTAFKEPFIPAKSTKPLTDVSDFELNTDRRAVRREEFDLKKKERECELEGLRRQREQQQKEEEEMAVLKMRAEMVHRSNPIRHYAPVLIKPSEKPLTQAESPRFSDRLR